VWQRVSWEELKRCEYVSTSSIQRVAKRSNIKSLTHVSTDLLQMVDFISPKLSNPLFSASLQPLRRLSHNYPHKSPPNMDPSELHAQLATLSSNIDTLESALAPLLTTPLPTLSAPLALLSKAKLSALSAYAIESLLFGSVRIAGSDARSHPVFAELARTRSCFERIARAEDPNRGKPHMRVDKDAARRFVKAGLAGNEALQRKQVHQSLQQQHNQHNRQLEQQGLKRKAEPSVEEDDDDGDNDDDEDDDDDEDEDDDNEEEVNEDLYGNDTAEGSSSSLPTLVTQNPSVGKKKSAKQAKAAKQQRKKQKKAQKKQGYQDAMAQSSRGSFSDASHPSIDSSSQGQKKQEKKRWTKKEKLEARLAKQTQQIPQAEQNMPGKSSHSR